MSVSPYLPLGMAGLLVFSAFFSASETALFSLDPVEIRRRTRSGVFAEALKWCVGHPRAVLVTILLSNLAVNNLYFALAGWWAASERGVFTTLVPLGALVALVCFGEILPKSVALGMAGPFSSAVAPLLQGWARVLSPVRVPLSGLLQFLARRVVSKPATARTLTQEELEEIIRRDPGRFGIDRRAAGVLEELVGLTSTQVREVMIPIVDLVPVDGARRADDALAELLGAGMRWALVQSRQGTAGYIDIKDLIVARPEVPVRQLTRPLAVIPELARLPQLLALFRSAHLDRALVVDEYGAEAGIVGRDDLTETVVGGLMRPEHEGDDLPARLRPHRGWEVSGALGVREFEDLFSVRLPIRRNRTIGGLIVEQLGTLPRGGERVSVAGLDLEVLGVSRGRVHKILVRFPDVAAGAPAEVAT